MSRHTGLVASTVTAPINEEHALSPYAETRAVHVLPAGALHPQGEHERVSVKLSKKTCLTGYDPGHAWSPSRLMQRRNPGSATGLQSSSAPSQVPSVTPLHDRAAAPQVCVSSDG